MGTSSSTAGPKGPAWTNAKSAATRLARNSPGATPRSVVRQVARALGGGAAGGGGSWSPGSTRAAQRLGGLLGGAARDGLAETARDLGIGDLGDKPTGQVVMELLDWVSQDSSDLDEQIARRAAEAVLAELVRDGVDLEAPIEPTEAADLFRAFLVQYLTRTIVTPIAKRLTENASASRARNLERNIARVVEALVRLEVSTEQLTSIDWLAPDGAATVDRIRTAALDLLAGDDT